MFKKNLEILNKKQKSQLFLLIFLFFPLNIIETLSFSSIPGFIILIDNPEILNNYVKINYFTYYLIELSLLERVYLGSFLLIIIFIIRGLAIFLINSLGFYFKYKITMSNSKKLYQSYLNKSYNFHIENNPANLTQNMNDAIKSTSVIFAYANIIKDCLLLIFILIAIYIATPSIFVQVLIFTFLPTLILFNIVKNKLKKIGEIARNYRLASHKSLLEGFSNIKYIFVSDSRDKFIQDFYKKQSKSQSQEKSFSVLNISPRIIIELSCLIFIILFIIFSSKNNQTLNEFIPTLTLIVVAAVRLIPALGQILVNLNTIKFQSFTVNRIYNEISNFESYSIKKPELKKKIDSFTKIIEIKKIRFSYNDKINVIDNFSFEIKKNEKIGFFGESGSGKTTITDIIMGLLIPNSGEIICDKVNIMEDLRGWRSQISFVPQNIILLDDTIKKNICFSLDNDSSFNPEKYKLALKISGLDKILEKFEEKDLSRIGYFSNKISGGQKQRIGIARAIYESKPILIMDEATNSLDEKSENEIINELLKLDLTVILITHNQELIKKCDRIIKIL